MIDIGSLIAGLGFRFRSVLNFIISGYLLAAVFSFFGKGDGGFSNLASVAGFFRLPELGRWICSIYTLLSGENVRAGISMILAVWLLIACLALLGTYKDGASLILMPDSTMAAALVFVLGADLVRSGWWYWLGGVAVVATLCSIWWCNRRLETSNGLSVSLVAFFGMLTAVIYVLVAPPLWLAGAERR